MTIHLAKGKTSQTLYPFISRIPKSTLYATVKVEISKEELRVMHEVINQYDALQSHLMDLFLQAEKTGP